MQSHERLLVFYYFVQTFYCFFSRRQLQWVLVSEAASSENAAVLQVDLASSRPRLDTLQFYYAPEAADDGQPRENKTVNGLTYRNPLIGYTVEIPVTVSLWMTYCTCVPFYFFCVCLLFVLFGPGMRVPKATHGCCSCQERLSPLTPMTQTPPPTFRPPSPFPPSLLPYPSLLSLPQYPFSPFSPPSFPSFPFPLLKSAKGLGSALAPSAGFGAEPRLLMHSE